jgi:hypothetical protein
MMHKGSPATEAEAAAAEEAGAGAGAGRIKRERPRRISLTRPTHTKPAGPPGGGTAGPTMVTPSSPSLVSARELLALLGVEGAEPEPEPGAAATVLRSRRADGTHGQQPLIMRGVRDDTRRTRGTGAIRNSVRATEAVSFDCCALLKRCTCCCKRRRGQVPSALRPHAACWRTESHEKLIRDFQAQVSLDCVAEILLDRSMSVKSIINLRVCCSRPAFVERAKRAAARKRSPSSGAAACAFALRFSSENRALKDGITTPLHSWLFYASRSILQSIANTSRMKF